MQCVYYERDFPNGFEEKMVYSIQTPYTIKVKNFVAEDIVPLHFSSAIEIILCDGIYGEIVIGNHHYQFGGQQLFVIPPYTLHASNIRPCNGIMYTFKIDFDKMAHYINIPHFMELRGLTMAQLRYDCPAYSDVMHIVRQLIRHDGDLTACLNFFLPLFTILSQHIVPEQTGSAMNPQLKSASLQDLMRWTNENYARKITIEDAAAMTGYSKFYFCSRFKALTGSTYLNYLNSVRLTQACLLLRSGKSVQNVCQSCGFENTSYFIQLFRKQMNMTPYQYALQQRTAPPEEAPVAPAGCTAPAKEPISIQP